MLNSLHFSKIWRTAKTGLLLIYLIAGANFSGFFFQGAFKKKVKKGQSEVQNSSADDVDPIALGAPWDFSHLVIWPVRSCLIRTQPGNAERLAWGKRRSYRTLAKTLYVTFKRQIPR
jgi:hypothetical protein